MGVFSKKSICFDAREEVEEEAKNKFYIFLKKYLQ